jgi:hypothetical protein
MWDCSDVYMSCLYIEQTTMYIIRFLICNTNYKSDQICLLLLGVFKWKLYILVENV